MCLDLTGWHCNVDGSGEEGQAGDPCDYINACDPGLHCVEAALIPGCAGEYGCCSPYCSTDQPNTCPNAGQGEACIPWYSEGQAPPQLITLGVCGMPT